MWHNGDAEKIQERKTVKHTFILSWKGVAAAVATALAMAFSLPLGVEATSAPKYHDIPAYQQKDIWETETVKFGGLVLGSSYKGNMTLYVFNTTVQELEAELEVKDGKVPEMNLKKDHNYMFFGQDGTKKTRVYGWVSGGKLLDIKSWDGYAEGKTYSELKELPIEEFKVGDEENRYFASIPVLMGDSDGPAYNRKFKLVSMYETLEVNTGKKGYLQANLLEDIAYTVILEDDDYFFQSFPLVVKDKREYDSAVRFTYDHSTCHSVGNMPGDESGKTPLRIYEKSKAKDGSGTITSLSERTTISGYQFNDIIAVERFRSGSEVNRLAGSTGGALPELADKNYFVLDIMAINPHRWEVSKLCEGSFRITEKLDACVNVGAVYELRDDGLKELAFAQNGGEVTFETDSLSLYPIVIVNNGYTHTYKTITVKAGLLKNGYTFKRCTSCGFETKHVFLKGYSTSYVKGLKVSALRKGFKVKWTKQSAANRKKFGGYQVMYSTSQKMTSPKYVTAKNSSSYRQVKSLKAGRRYYIKVRTYTVSKGVKYYSKWSAVKSVKAK